MNDLDKNRLLTTKEVAQLLGISHRTVRNGTGPKAFKPFVIPHIKVGRLVRFRAKDVQAFLNGE